MRPSTERHGGNSGAADYWRQLDLVAPADFKDTIHVIGIGGIGSPTVMALAKMGCPSLVIYDDDKVEEHNLPNQWYRLKDLGQFKVDSLADICYDFTGVRVFRVAERIDKQQLSGIVISGVDSMESRKSIYENVIKGKDPVALYIDARMGAEVARILCVKPRLKSSLDWYETTLYNDEEASELPCTARAIIYNTFGIASWIARQVRCHVRGQAVGREVLFDYATGILGIDDRSL